MTETGTTATLDVEMPDQRPCTRCDGTQYLLARSDGMGKYRCDGCELVVGFDLESAPVEFLLHRGLPSRYTKQWFGPRLAPEELRLDSQALAS